MLPDGEASGWRKGDAEKTGELGWRNVCSVGVKGDAVGSRARAE